MPLNHTSDFVLYSSKKVLWLMWTGLAGYAESIIHGTHCWARSLNMRLPCKRMNGSSLLIENPILWKGSSICGQLQTTWISLLSMTSCICICNKYRLDLRSMPGIHVSGSPWVKDRHVQASVSLWGWAVLSIMKNILEIKNIFMAYLSLPTNNLAVCP